MLIADRTYLGGGNQNADKSILEPAGEDMWAYARPVGQRPGN